MTAQPARDSHPSGNGAVALGTELSLAPEATGNGARWRAQVGDVETGRFTELMIRVVDIAGAAVISVLLSPLLLLVAIAVRLDSRGPSIYRQRRLGRNLEPFSVAKFRTMREGSGSDAHRLHVQQMIAGEGAGVRPMTKLCEDERVTRVGAFLRRTSIDELPQLWNVLRGQMSLVGPRPPIEYEVEEYPSWAFRRFAVKPGITGLWQVRGRSLLTFEQMIGLDTEYVERRSLALNLKILVLTLPTVIHGQGAA
jgi:lipopolysaccharide/colanic/teichoic acid biosynthesis glycosyltransferase